METRGVPARGRAPRRALLPAGLFFLCVFLFPADLAAQFADSTLGSDDLWEPLFPWSGGPRRADGGIAGVDRLSLLGDALVIYGSDLHAIDGTPVNQFAMFVDDQWRAMAQDPPPSYPRILLARGEELLVGSSISSPETDPQGLFYKWNGTEWQNFGPQVDWGDWAYVTEMTLFRGRLAAVIESETSTVLLWDGDSWTDITPDHDSYSGWYAFSLCEYRGDLYLGGSTRTVDGLHDDYLIRWDGSVWDSVAVEIDGTVSSMVAVGDDLYLKGSFTHAGGIETAGLARWNGTDWSDLSRLPGGKVSARQLFRFGSRLLGWGIFRFTSEERHDLAVWNDTSWTPVPVPLTGRNFDYVTVASDRVLGWEYQQNHVFALGVEDPWTPIPDWELHPTPGSNSFVFLSRSSDLLLAGTFNRPGQAWPTTGILRWNGTAWSTLADGFDGAIHCLKEFRGELLAGGEFQNVHGRPLRGLARLTPEGWKPLGDGVDFFVTALSPYGTRLMAGGFIVQDHKSYGRIQAWDGRTWSDLGRGLVGWPARVRDIETYDGSLWVGGSLAWAGDQRVMTLTRWDGYFWRGTIEQDPFPTEYSSLSRLYDWRGRLVAVGGRGPLSFLRAWDGGTWSTLSDSLFMVVNDVAEHEGRLVLAGEDGDYRGPRLLEWDGMTWWSAGSGLRQGNAGNPGDVTACTVWKGDLYVAGDFEVAGNRPAQSVAVFRDSTKTHPAPPVSLTVTPNPAPRGPVSVRLLVIDPGPASIRIVDVTGREIRRILDDTLSGGEHVFEWDLRDQRGLDVASGIYFVAARSDAGISSQRLVVVRN